MSAPPDTLTVLHSVTEKHAAKQIRRHPNGKVTNKSYDSEKFFRVEERPVGTFAELCETLAALTNLRFAFPIRGAPLPDINRHHARRLLHPDKGDPPTFHEVPRRWFMVDVDHIPAPALADPITDPEGAVEYVIGLLPPELADVSCFWQWSSSQSLPILGEQDTLSLHLWYFAAAALTGAELTRWTVAHNRAAATKLIDPAAHRAAQPLYTAAPLFSGMTDPLPRRCGIRRGLEDEAVLVVPPADRRNPETASGEGYEPGLGVAAYLAKIGPAEGVRQPILSAIASYIAIHGGKADCEPLKKAIRDAIDAADLPGHSDETLERYKSDKHLDEIIAWVRQKHGDQPPRPFPPPPDDNAAAYAELIKTFNERYAVANEAGKVIIFEPVKDPVLRRRVLTRISFADLRKLYMNRQLTMTIGEAEITKTHADWWLSSPQRRQYLGGVIFDPKGAAPPDYWNLWNGFAVDAAPGDWSRMQEHIWRVICAGDDMLNEYLLNLIARMFQHPNRPGEVAPVFRGLRGAGKGIFLNWLLSAWGQHGVHISNARHLVGNFNAHMRDCVMVFADEAFFAGDRQHEGVLKALITEPTLPIEGKGRDLVEVINMLHLFISSNSDWVVPAAIDERRFFVTDVADNRLRDFAYFAAIDEQMKTGGLAALIHDMLHRDISHFEVRDVPNTAALKTQKTLSLGSIERWWLAVLSRGFLWRSRHGAPWFGEWHDFYSTELLWRSYAQWCDEARPFDRKHREQLGKFFTNTHQASRPAGKHPVGEIDNIDMQRVRGVRDRFGVWIEPPEELDDVAIAYQKRPPGYDVGEFDDARARFLDLHEIDAPW